MRNKYPGICYRCAKDVVPGHGHFERFKGGWRVQHASCAIKYRSQIDPERAAYNRSMKQNWIIGLKIDAKGTGRRAQRARRKLRAELQHNLDALKLNT